MNQALQFCFFKDKRCYSVEQTQSYNVFLHLSYVHIFNLWDPYEPRRNKLHTDISNFPYELWIQDNQPLYVNQRRKESELTIQEKKVFPKILAQGKFFLNCFQYKWAVGKTIESGCVLARKKYVQRRTILLKHQGISLFF